MLAIALNLCRIYGTRKALSSIKPQWEGGSPMRDITIVVNGTAKIVHKEELTFDEIVKLAYETPPYGDNTLFSVTYRKGPGHKPEGILAPGESIKVQNGMIFDVTATDKS